MRGTPDERFDAKWEEDENGCHIWTAGRCTKGYGSFYVLTAMQGRKTVLAHRFSYVRMHGAIPQGLECDHLCRVRACCNPAHIELVTHVENVHRGDVWKIKGLNTHCPHGHPFDDANTGFYTSPAGKTQRLCRECRRGAARRAYYARLKKRRSQNLDES